MYTYDVALLRLDEHVDLKKYRPACLPHSGDNFEGYMGSAYGED